MPSFKSRKAGDVRIETQSPLTSRSMRNPRYDFYGDDMPAGVLLPVAFAPVLAGDTLKASKMMARIIGAEAGSSSIRAVRGNWFESWLFYVRIGDMAGADELRDLIVDPAATATVNWRDKAFEPIWRAYFTDDPIGDATTPTPAYVPFSAAATGNTGNYLRLPGNGWWDSLTKNSDLPDVSSASGDDWQEQWIRYQALRRARLTTATWEEYLAKSGVAVGPQLRQGDNDPSFRVPELLKWTREFAYPQPAGYNQDGVEQFRTQWFIQQSLERGRFCAEPGFLVSCIAMRPKAYRIYDPDVFDPLELLNTAEGWLPTDFDTDPHASLVNVPAAVLGDTTPGAEATLDARDLFLYGDQITADPVYPFTSPISGASAHFPISASDRYTSALTATFSCDLQVSHRIASRIGTDTTAG